MHMLKHLIEIFKKTDLTDTYPSDYFTVNFQILKIASILNRTSPPSIIIFILCIGFCTPSEFYSLWFTKSNINDFVMNLGIALTHGVASIKVINWYVRQSNIIGIMKSLDREDLRYDSIGDFKPGLIMQNAKRTNIIVSTLFFWSAVLVPFAGYSQIFINFIINPGIYISTIEVKTENSTEIIEQFTCQFPFYSWIPFNHSSTNTCILANIFQSFLMMYLTLMIVAVDTLFMGLVNYLTAHFMVLQGAIRTMRERSAKKYGINQKLDEHNDDLEVRSYFEMKKCLKHLQTIQDFCANVEDIYSIQMLCQVLVSLFVLCTCLYLISTEPLFSKTFIVEVTYIFALEYQLTLYCWFGNELTLSSLGINDALYESNWIPASEKLKKLIIITMIRMKRPVYITVGKFTPLTVQTLQAILRGSYSLYAVLKNRNSD